MPARFVESLESRSLLAVVYPTAVEQYVLELINRARANPTAEATRSGVALNEGLPANTITTAAKQPMAINPYVTDAARKHSAWMIANQKFSHTGASNSDPGKRLTTAAYKFVAPYTWGENIGYRSSYPTVPDPTATAAQVHKDLFVDKGIAGRGHRTNLMSNAFKEIGVGVATGKFKTYNAVMLTTDFATSGTASFVTGVAYSDKKTKDKFYTVGEGLNAVMISAKRVSDSKVFTTKTWASGGYRLQLNPGTYNITATGGGLGALKVSYSNVKIGSNNVKRDFRPDMAPPAGGARSLARSHLRTTLTLASSSPTAEADRANVGHLTFNDTNPLR